MSAQVTRNWRKLTPEDVGEIRIRAAAGAVRAELAREHKVAHQTIAYHIYAGKALDNSFGDTLERAAHARRTGNHIEAARQLRIAADILEQQERKEAS